MSYETEESNMDLLKESVSEIREMTKRIDSMFKQIKKNPPKDKLHDILMHLAIEVDNLKDPTEDAINAIKGMLDEDDASKQLAVLEQMGVE